MLEEMLVHEVVPRLRNVAGTIPKVGHEDDEEIVQDATLIAARMMDSAEKASVRWTGFLREMEPLLPGISGAARNLLTTLVFGLGLMAPKSRGITLSGVEAMARFLVRRMASARIAIVHASEVARRRGLITRVFHKLGSGPANERKICRDLKITAADRDEALRWLEPASLVLRQQDGWDRRDGARLSFTNCSVPILEV